MRKARPPAGRPSDCRGTYPRLGPLRPAIVDGVADRAHGAQQVAAAMEVERLAQAPDMHVDGADFELHIRAPDAVQQLLAGKHAPRVLQEVAQQAEFGRADMNGLARARY